MSLDDLVRLALGALRRNLLRSSLTMLGIVIGVAAVIAMVTMGAGVTAQVGESLANLGTRLLLVRPGESHPSAGGARLDAPAFTLADVQAIERGVSGASAVAPVDSSPMRVI